jgi:hypothetical protein
MDWIARAEFAPLPSLATCPWTPLVYQMEKLERVTADILPDNVAMQRVCQKLGFRLEHSMEERLVKAAVAL